MLKNRLIPVLLLKNGVLVRSEDFNFHQVIGNPIHEVERFNEWNVDELIYVDISREDETRKTRKTRTRAARASLAVPSASRPDRRPPVAHSRASPRGITPPVGVITPPVRVIRPMNS